MMAAISQTTSPPARDPANSCRHPTAVFVTLSLLGVAICGLTTPAPAQIYERGTYESGLDTVVRGETLEGRLERRQLPIGAHLGAFWIRPELQLDEALDNNIFATQSGKRSDAITTLTGRFAADYAFDSNRLSFDGYGAGHKYATNPTEDAWEGAAHTIFDGEVHDDVHVVADGAVKRLVDPRTDPTGLSGLRPTTYLVYEGRAGALLGHADRNIIDTHIEAKRTVYDSLIGRLGPIDTTDRNRTEVSAEGNFAHRFFDQQRVYVKIRPDTRMYDRRFDDNGFQRSSSGIRANVGGTLDLNSIIVLNLESGYQFQNYDDPRFGSIGEPDITLSGSWWPTQLTMFSAKFTHEYYEAFFITSPGAVRNQVVLRVDHELRRRLLLTSAATFERDDTVKVPSRIVSELAELKLQYRFADGFAAVAGYTFAHQTSTAGAQTNTGSTNFDKSVVTLTLKKLF
jgi:hypothetical protein